MTKVDESWCSDPCICGDKETWHPECYARLDIDAAKKFKSFGFRKWLGDKTAYLSELHTEIERLHRAMADLQNMEAAAMKRVMDFEEVVKRLMSAKENADAKGWLSLHHELYALMPPTNTAMPLGTYGGDEYGD